MKRIFYVILALFTVALFGCSEKGEGSVPFAPGPRSFAPRDVNYLWVVPAFFGESLQMTFVSFNQELDCNTYPDCYIASWSNIDAPIPALERQRRELASCYDFIWFIPMPDMVEYIRTYRETYPSTFVDGPVLPMLIEYRTEGIADMQITCDRKLFGKEPGESLNEYFTVDCYGGLVDQVGSYSYGDYKHINMDGPEKPLNDWLKLKPLVPEWFFVRANGIDISKEEQESTTIIVNVSTTTGKRFRTAHNIALNPDVQDLGIFSACRPELLATRLDQ